MNPTIEQVIDMIEFWKGKPDSKQKSVVLAYWIKQAQEFIKYSRTVYTNGGNMLISNSSEEVKIATRLVARHFGVPQKRAGENRYTSMYRLTRL